MAVENHSPGGGNGEKIHSNSQHNGRDPIRKGSWPMYWSCRSPDGITLAIQVGPASKDKRLYKRNTEGRHRDPSHRDGDGAMAWECLEVPEVGRSKGWIPPQSLGREYSPVDTLIPDFWPLEQLEYKSPLF